MPHYLLAQLKTSTNEKISAEYLFGEADDTGFKFKPNSPLRDALNLSYLNLFKDSAALSMGFANYIRPGDTYGNHQYHSIRGEDSVTEVIPLTPGEMVLVTNMVLQALGKK